MADYLSRIVDDELVEKLSYAGAVVIRGPKWCGKTATALQRAQSVAFLQDPDERANNMAIADAKPSLLLQGQKPRLIDEWQEAPQLWDAVRFAVDRSNEPGQFMLTGSATPTARPHHTGTGRFSFLDMRTMSLFESGDSTGEVSLKHLFGNVGHASQSDISVEGYSNQDIESLSYAVCRGGWPRAVTISNERAALAMSRDYLSAIAEEDVSRVDGVKRNPQYARIIMQAYARCSATQADMSTVRNNLRAHGNDMSRETINSYIGALRNLYVIEDVPAWAPSLHAKSRITTTPARFFTDPSIAAAALGASPQLLLRDLSAYGLLFENLCVRDLRVYVEPLNGRILHYRDNTGLEADCVIVLDDGRYALLEVKMSSKLIDEAAENLKKLVGKIDPSIMGAPSFCAVLTPGGYAYQRNDGILVIPITCLRP
ncbi:ATP-binding protein [Rubneribacter sp.]